ncbi:MAG: oligosaccharide flippase family protein [Bacteroidales bacterium]|nr:oligosaccharide flippase family protein [Bacteroidales bacterium]
MRNYRQSEFTKSVVTLASGSSIAQLIPFAAEPILSRLFTPAEFGIFEIYAAVVLMLGAIASARYEMAIVLPKLENKATNLLGLSVVIVVIFALFCTAFILVSENRLTVWINNPEFSRYLYYIPIGIFLVGINRSFLFWALRQKYMKMMSLSRILESSGKAGSSIVFGIIRFSSFGLILGQIIGLVVSTALLIFSFLRFDRKNIRFLTWKHFLRQAKVYSEFPKINVPIAISEMIQISGIIFIFSFFFDNTKIGEFSKALRIMLIPLNLIGTSVAQVFYQKASKDILKGADISVGLKKIVRNLAFIALPAFVLLLFISPWLFGFVLGKDWVTAGEYARILAPWIFVKFFITPVTVVPLIINKQGEYFFINVVGNIMMIAAVAIPGAFDMGILPTLYILTVSQVVFLLFLYIRVMSAYKHYYNFERIK